MNNTTDRVIKCAKCGAAFTCKPRGNCWCNHYQLSTAQLQELKDNYADCLCEGCLILLAEKIRKTT